MSLDSNPETTAENLKYIKLGFEGPYTSSRSDNKIEIQISNLTEEQKREIIYAIKYGG